MAYPLAMDLRGYNQPLGFATVMIPMGITYWDKQNAKASRKSLFDYFNIMSPMAEADSLIWSWEEMFRRLRPHIVPA